MKNILLFGAGKSATLLIDYLLENAPEEDWRLTVVDAHLPLVQEKLKGSPYGTALSFDVTDEIRRQYYIEQSDIVLSLLPPLLHRLVAADCLHYRKHLLTASYVDDEIARMGEEAAEKDLLFLCEMGLDPGLDHMSARKLIDDIRLKEGMVTSFLSHCGGLVAPASDDNPWHYKISWNPRNVVLAGKGGAVFRQNGKVENVPYEGIFAEKRYVVVPGHDLLCWYPNRDSESYAGKYALSHCPTFVRTTLRHPDFMYGWKNLVDLKLTDETLLYETDGKSLMEFFKEHLDRNQFNDWLEQRLQQQFQVTQQLLTDLMNLVELEETSAKEGNEAVEDFLMVNSSGELQEVDMADLKNNAAATIAFKMHEAKLTLKQLFFLGLDDGQTLINKGRCSAADVLQFALEKKLALAEQDKDMVVMMHEVEYELPEENPEVRGSGNEGHSEEEKRPRKKFRARSSMTLIGEDGQRTAMAKTVGLPMGVATKLILAGRIPLRGLQIPTAKEIYVPVLNELKKHGIEFTEQHEEI
ncbi:saccharopine dehydrogenase C-terminal domain-containing protein [Paraflavisolibacter sp. H34]|uniref:saccharopine dehydrogenase C-terminal domain-containing protein n=1 Tax=Huijunlia imazamoxiresistens TaxID=3127457 RepID=UPI003015FCF0